MIECINHINDIIYYDEPQLVYGYNGNDYYVGLAIPIDDDNESNFLFVKTTIEQEIFLDYWNSNQIENIKNIFDGKKIAYYTTYQIDGIYQINKQVSYDEVPEKHKIGHVQNGKT